MKKSTTNEAGRKLIPTSKKQTVNKIFIAVLFLMVKLTLFSQTNYYLITDSVKSGNAVTPTVSKVGFWSTDGTVNGQRPANFTDAGQVFNIQVSGLTNSKSWTVSGTGSKIVVGTDTATSAFTFTSSNPSNITATVDVKPNSTFYYLGANTSGITWGTLAVGSTVNFAGNYDTYQQVLPGYYYNLSLKVGPGSYLPLVLPQGGIIHVAGTFTPRASADYGSTIDFNGTGGQYIPAGNYYNITESGTKSTPDSLKGTIYVAGSFINNSGTPSVPYTISSTGTITSSTVAYNGLKAAGQTLGNQSYYNLTFNNGQTFIVTGFNYDSSYITLAQPNPELSIGDSVSAVSTIFPSLNSAAIKGFGATTDTVFLTLPPALQLIVHPVGGGSDTVLVAAYNLKDSSLTLTAPPAFNTGDTLYSCQILTTPTKYYVGAINGDSITLSSSKVFSEYSGAGLLGASLSIGTSNKLPTMKTITGTINIKNTFSASTGSINTTGSTISFIGSKQTVPGITYNNLTINEANATTATLGGSALVEGIFNLQSGKLTTSTSKLLTLDVNATFPTVTNDTFFVNGPLVKNFASTNPFTYQIGAVSGNVSSPRTVTITPKTADPKTYTATYVVGNSGYPTTYLIGVSSIDPLSFYRIGLSNYSAGADTTAQLTFEFAPDTYCQDSIVTLAHYFSGAYRSESNAQFVFPGSTTPLYFTTYGYDNLFGHYNLGVTSSLPVKLGNITAAELANATVKVSWESYTEISVSKFVVEGSKDGINFIEKGALPAKGASEYSFTDVYPNDGINYYRIKTVDNDGNFTYSNVVAININKINETKLSVYPNPVVNKQLNLVLNTEAANYTLKVTNVLGKSVFESNINHAGGTTSYNVALPSALAKGIYFVKLTNGKDELTKTVVVE